MPEDLTNFLTVKQIRQHFSLTQEQMADLLYIDKRTYVRYDDGTRQMPRPIFELLKYKILELQFGLTDIHYQQHGRNKKADV